MSLHVEATDSLKSNVGLWTAPGVTAESEDLYIGDVAIH